MPRYTLTVAYDGTDFHGWQKQEPPDQPPLRTAQGVLEETVRDVVREPIRLIGASRTDSGVHAVGQVAAFTCNVEIPLDKLPRAINSRLPDDIQVRCAKIVHDEFSPISEATRKGYRYSFAHSVRGEKLAPLFERHFVFHTVHVLDVDRMNAGAQKLIGEHDFASFAQVSHGRTSTVRTVFDCSVEATQNDRCRLDISGNGFLYNMVRIVAGTLLDIGRGRLSPEDVTRILEARDRQAAGPTLPAHGLCLRWIEYGDS